MRKNYFGESYCHTVQEIKAEAEYWGSISAVSIDPPEGDDRACAIIADDADGEPVFYVEADTEEEVKDLLAKAGIPIVADH